MNYRKWPMQSVLLFVILVAADIYYWKVQGKPFHLYKLADYIPFAVAAGWLMTLSGEARRAGFLTWVASAILMQISLAILEGMISLSPLADAVGTSASALFPVFVAVGVALLWQRRERLRLRPCVKTHGYTARTPRNTASRG